MNPVNKYSKIHLQIVIIKHASFSSYYWLFTADTYYHFLMLLFVFICKSNYFTLIVNFKWTPSSVAFKKICPLLVSATNFLAPESSNSLRYVSCFRKVAVNEKF